MRHDALDVDVGRVEGICDGLGLHLGVAQGKDDCPPATGLWLPAQIYSYVPATGMRLKPPATASSSFAAVAAPLA